MILIFLTLTSCLYIFAFFGREFVSLRADCAGYVIPERFL